MSKQLKKGLMAILTVVLAIVCCFTIVSATAKAEEKTNEELFSSNIAVFEGITIDESILDAQYHDAYFNAYYAQKEMDSNGTWAEYKAANATEADLFEEVCAIYKDTQDAYDLIQGQMHELDEMSQVGELFYNSNSIVVKAYDAYDGLDGAVDGVIANNNKQVYIQSQTDDLAIYNMVKAIMDEYARKINNATARIIGGWYQPKSSAGYDANGLQFYSVAQKEMIGYRKIAAFDANNYKVVIDSLKNIEGAEQELFYIYNAKYSASESYKYEDGADLTPEIDTLYEAYTQVLVPAREAYDAIKTEAGEMDCFFTALVNYTKYETNADGSFKVDAEGALVAREYPIVYTIKDTAIKFEVVDADGVLIDLAEIDGIEGALTTYEAYLAANKAPNADDSKNFNDVSKLIKKYDELGKLLDQIDDMADKVVNAINKIDAIVAYSPVPFYSGHYEDLIVGAENAIKALDQDIKANDVAEYAKKVADETYVGKYIVTNYEELMAARAGYDRMVKQVADMKVKMETLLKLYKGETVEGVEVTTYTYFLGLNEEYQTISNEQKAALQVETYSFNGRDVKYQYIINTLKAEIAKITAFANEFKALVDALVNELDATADADKPALLLSQDYNEDVAWAQYKYEKILADASANYKQLYVDAMASSKATLDNINNMIKELLAGANAWKATVVGEGNTIEALGVLADDASKLTTANIAVFETSKTAFGAMSAELQAAVKLHVDYKGAYEIYAAAEAKATALAQAIEAAKTAMSEAVLDKALITSADVVTADNNAFMALLNDATTKYEALIALNGDNEEITIAALDPKGDEEKTEYDHYVEMLNYENVIVVEVIINAIYEDGSIATAVEVSLANKEDIADAKEAYDELTDAEKALVRNYKAVAEGGIVKNYEDAAARFADLTKSYDEMMAKVWKLIANFDKVTVEDIYSAEFDAAVVAAIALQEAIDVKTLAEYRNEFIDVATDTLIQAYLYPAAKAILALTARHEAVADEVNAQIATWIGVTIDSTNIAAAKELDERIEKLYEEQKKNPAGTVVADITSKWIDASTFNVTVDAFEYLGAIAGMIDELYEAVVVNGGTAEYYVTEIKIIDALVGVLSDEQFSVLATKTGEELSAVEKLEKAKEAIAISGANEEIIKLNAVKADLEKLVELLYTDFAADENVIEVIKAKIAAIDTEIAAIKAGDEVTASTLATLGDDLAKVTDDLKKFIEKTYADKVAELEAGIAAAATVTEFTALQNNFNGYVSSTNTKLSQIEASIAKTLTDAKTYTDAEIVKVTNVLNTAKAELTSKIGEVETKLNAAITALETKLNTKVQELTDALNTAKQELSNAQAADKAELEGKIAKLESDLADAVAALEKALADTEKDLTDALAKEVANLNNTITIITIILSVVCVAMAACIVYFFLKRRA